MKSLILAIFVVLTCLPVSEVCGQVKNYRGWVVPPANPRDRRMLRERAVAYAGPASRGLVESEYGDYAALALLRCSKGSAATLAGFYDSGDLDRVPRARDLLMVIAQPSGGDGVCTFAIQHANELTDPYCCDAFLAAPLEYVFKLKQLPEPAPVRQPEFLLPRETDLSIPWSYSRRSLIWVAGLIGVAALLIWRKRQRFARDYPA